MLLKFLLNLLGIITISSFQIPFDMQSLHGLDVTKLFDPALQMQEGKLQSNYKMKCPLKERSSLFLTFWTVDGGVPDGTKFKILSDSSLLVRNISEGDFDREYLCHIIVPGQETVESVQTYLRNSQIVQKEEGQMDNLQSYSTRKEIFALVGSEKVLTCSVTARPSPEFKWIFNNGTLIQNQTDFIVTANEGTSNLTILLRDPSYFTQYICEAWNRLGKSEQVFELKIPAKPEGLPFVYPRMITSNKIILGINYDRSKNLSALVQYREAEDTLWRGVSANNEEQSVEISNLNPNASYWIRAALKNDFTLGEFSDPIIVNTDKMHSVTKKGSVRTQITEPLNTGRSLFDSGDNGELLGTSDESLQEIIKANTITKKWRKKINNRTLIFTNSSVVEEVETLM